MSDTAITATLDRERALDVLPHVLELERLTGAGIGRLVGRVIAGEYHAGDLSETVRLALIGGGTTPAEAVTLARVYVKERPLTEGHALATEILLAAWNGTTRTAAEIERPKPDLNHIVLQAKGQPPQKIQADGTLAPLWSKSEPAEARV